MFHLPSFKYTPIHGSTDCLSHICKLQPVCLLLPLPYQNRRPPCQPGSKSCQNYFFTFTYHTMFIDIIKQNRHTRRGNITALFQIGRKLFHRLMQSFCNRLNNAQIRLMQYKQVNIFDFQSRFFTASSITFGTVFTANLYTS